MFRRRRRRPSIIEAALLGNWTISAVLAAACLGFVFIAIPALQASSNPFLHIAVLGLEPIGLILGGLFGITAAFKCVQQFKAGKKIGARAAASTSGGNFTATRAMEKTWRGPLPRRNVKPLHERPDVWTLEFLQSIEWKKFEELSTAYYQEKGIRAEATPLGADGGIDIKLYHADSADPMSIVECKAWNARLVGVKEIREFLEVMSHEKLAKGFYMTSGGYTAEAMQFAKANSITLISGEMLLMMIRRLPKASQKKLMALASAGDYTTPTCPSCGVKMVKRLGRREFWACKNYPKCRLRLYVQRSTAMAAPSV